MRRALFVRTNHFVIPSIEPRIGRIACATIVRRYLFFSPSTLTDREYEASEVSGEWTRSLAAQKQYGGDRRGQSSEYGECLIILSPLWRDVHR